MKILSMIFVAVVSFSYAQEAKTEKEPVELTQLREQWQRARTQAIEPIDKKYVQMLEEQKLRFTKAGKLEEAVALKAEIDKMGAGDQSLVDSAQNGSISAKVIITPAGGEVGHYQGSLKSSFAINAIPRKASLTFSAEPKATQYGTEANLLVTLQREGDKPERGISHKIDQKAGQEVSLDVTKLLKKAGNYTLTIGYEGGGWITKVSKLDLIIE